MSADASQDQHSGSRRRGASRLTRRTRLLIRRVVRPILRINDSPHALALGLTLGLFVAFTPTVGIQIPIVVVLGTIMKANRIAAVAMTWISNPVTMVPLYYGYYRLGLVVMGRRGVSYDDIREILGQDQSWTLFLELIERLGLPLWVGSLIVATIFTVPAYPIFRRLLERRAENRRKKREAAFLAARPSPGGGAS